jgi:hypothetical protein
MNLWPDKNSEQLYELFEDAAPRLAGVAPPALGPTSVCIINRYGPDRAIGRFDR